MPEFLREVSELPMECVRGNLHVSGHLDQEEGQTASDRGQKHPCQRHEVHGGLQQPRMVADDTQREA